MLEYLDFLLLLACFLTALTIWLPDLAAHLITERRFKHWLRTRHERDMRAISETLSGILCSVPGSETAKEDICAQVAERPCCVIGGREGDGGGWARILGRKKSCMIRMTTTWAHTGYRSEHSDTLHRVTGCKDGCGVSCMDREQSHIHHHLQFVRACMKSVLVDLGICLV